MPCLPLVGTMFVALWRQLRPWSIWRWQPTTDGSAGGFGPERVRGVHESLAGRFRRPTPLHGHYSSPQPSVRDLRNIDREYRTKAPAGALAGSERAGLAGEHSRRLVRLRTCRDSLGMVVASLFGSMGGVIGGLVGPPLWVLAAGVVIGMMTGQPSMELLKNVG